MIPNLYIQNGCFTKHQFINWLFGVPGSRVFFSFPRQTWSPSRSTISRGTLTVEVSNQRSVDRFNVGKGFFPTDFLFFVPVWFGGKFGGFYEIPCLWFLNGLYHGRYHHEFHHHHLGECVFWTFSQASFPSKSQSLVKICDFAEKKTGLCLMVMIIYEL